MGVSCLPQLCLTQHGLNNPLLPQFHANNPLISYKPKNIVAAPVLYRLWPLYNLDKSQYNKKNWHLATDANFFKFKLNSRFVNFTGSNANNLFNVKDEYFTVADLPGPSRL